MIVTQHATESDVVSNDRQGPEQINADGGSGDTLHVVLGTGQVGTAIARVVRGRGREDGDETSIRMVSRSGARPAELDPSVEIVAADLSDAESAVAACRGASVVYFTAQPPYTEWPERFPPLLEGAIAGAAAADATLVVADNCYMYGPVDGPLTEDLPYSATTRKGRTRAAMAERVLTAHADGDVRATIGRASDFYGPGVTDSSVGERVFEPVLAGKTVYLLGDPDAPHTYAYIDDFARGLIVLGEHEEALGDAWYVPSGPTTTAREFVQMVGNAAGTDVSVRRLPSWLFRIVSRFDATMAEVREMLYVFEEPFVLDHSKYEAAFGADPTPHEDAIEATVEWFRTRGE